MADFNGRTAQQVIDSLTDLTLTETQFRADISDSINRVGDNCDRLDRDKIFTLIGDTTGTITVTGGFTEGIGSQVVTIPTEIAANVITTVELADNAVETANILDANVTTAKILDVNVTTPKIADLAVTTGKLATDAVDGTKIADDAIANEHIAADAVQTDSDYEWCSY